MSIGQEKMMNYMITALIGLMSFLSYQVWNLSVVMPEFVATIRSLEANDLKQDNEIRTIKVELDERTKERFTRSDSKDLKKDIDKSIDRNTDEIKENRQRILTLEKKD